MRIWFIVVAVLLATDVSSYAGADIYVWRDSLGVSHYTTDLANVPPEYRTDALTVAKDWVRPELPPAEVAAEPASLPVSDAKAAARLLVEDAYSAGYRAGETATALVPATSAAAPVVQNFQQSVQVQQAEAAAPHDRLVPVLVEPRRRSGPGRGKDEDERRKNFPPAQRAPFLQGPAGPPPVSFDN